MDTTIPATPTTIFDLQSSGVSWGSIAAGAVGACALTLLLVALGAGLGLSAVSPWSDSGVSATTFKVGTGIYLIVVAVMASSVGGYLAARLRTKWTGIHTNEAFFRDTAHGFLAWAFSILLSASILAAATSHIVSGVAQGFATAAPQTAAQNISPLDIATDKLFRTDAAAPLPASNATSSDPARTEVSKLLTFSFRESGDLSAADRTYVARVVAARTGLSQPEAERRVTEVVAEAKQAIDNARKAGAKLALWLTAALLFGAFAASFAAVEGGQLRDGTWHERRLVPRSI